MVLNKTPFSRKPLPIVTTTTQGTSQKRTKSQVKERSSVKCTSGPHVINSIMNSQQSAHDVHKINLAKIPGSTIGSGWLPGKERPPALDRFLIVQWTATQPSLLGFGVFLGFGGFQGSWRREMGSGYDYLALDTCMKFSIRNCNIKNINVNIHHYF